MTARACLSRTCASTHPAATHWYPTSAGRAGIAYDIGGFSTSGRGHAPHVPDVTSV
jgi:hypothetical protein